MQTNSSFFKIRLITFCLVLNTNLLVSNSCVFAKKSDAGKDKLSFESKNGTLNQEFWKKEKNKHELISSDEHDLMLDYCLAHYYKGSISEVTQAKLLENIINKDKSFCCYDVVIKSLAETGQIVKILALPIFDDLEKIYKNTDKETAMFLTALLDQVGKTGYSEKLLENLERDFSEDESVNFFIINKLISSKQFDAALSKIDNFLNTASINHKHVPFFLVKAILLVDHMNDLEKGLNTIEQGLSVSPFNEKLLQLKFNIFTKQGNQVEATAVLQELSMLSQDIELKKVLISRYLILKDFDKALMEICSLADTSPSVVLSKIFVLSQMNQKQLALDEVDKFIKVNKPSQEFLSIRRQLLFELKKFDQLVQELCLELFSQKKLDKECKELFVRILHLSKFIKAPQKVIDCCLENLDFLAQDYSLVISLGDFCLKNHFFVNAFTSFLYLTWQQNVPQKAKLYCLQMVKGIETYL